jgi:glycosyltransferase involved in cell wall biosynthesis
MKICIDGRRSFGSGIGRVTSSLIQELLARKGDHNYIVLRCIDSAKESLLASSSDLFVDMPFFSLEDVIELPRLLEENDVDLFISPQFYISPFIQCKTIKYVHDLWPIIYPQWLPTYGEFVGHFGDDRLKGINLIISHFLREFKRGNLFPDNIFLHKVSHYRNVKSTYKYIVSMLALTLHTADSIVVPSMHTYFEIKRYFPEILAKVSVIGNFIDQRFTGDVNPSPRPIIFHVSKWEPRKNLLRILHACQIARSGIPDLKLKIAGSQGYRRYGQSVLQLIQRPEFSEFVDYVGVVSDDEIKCLFSEAAAFIFPSLYEGFGIPILEAMSAGVPVIAGNVSAMPEIAGGAARLVNPKSMNEIVKAIHEIISEEGYAEYLSSLGRQRFQEYIQLNQPKKLFRLIESLDTILPNIKMQKADAQDGINA